MMHIVHMLPPYAQVKCNSLLLKYHNIESIFVKNCLCCMWIQSSGHTLAYRVQRPPSSNIQVHSVNLISQRMSDMVFFMMLSGFHIGKPVTTIDWLTENLTLYGLKHDRKHDNLNYICFSYHVLEQTWIQLMCLYSPLIYCCCIVNVPRVLRI